MLCFSQVYAIRCRPSLAAILCSTRIRTRTRTRTRTSQLTTAVKHTHKAEFIPKLTSKKQLPAELINARRLKFAGLAFSLASLGTALTVGIAEGVPLPVVPTWLLWGVTVVGAGSTALLWAATQQEVQVELHSGRLYIQWGSPSEGAPLAAESIQVCAPCDHTCTSAPMPCITQLYACNCLPPPTVLAIHIRMQEVHAPCGYTCTSVPMP